MNIANALSRPVAFFGRLTAGLLGASTGLLATFGILFANISSGYSQSAEELQRVRDWTIFCDRKIEGQAKSHNCVAATAVVADNDQSAWLKLAFEIVSSRGDLEMTMRIPRVNYFRRGISLTSEGEQIGRAFVDSCDEKACQTSVAVEAKLLTYLLRSNSISFEYQTGQEQGIRLDVDVRDFPTVFEQLSKRAGLDSNSTVAQSLPTVPNLPTHVRLTLARSTHQEGRPAQDVAMKCRGKSGTVNLSVSAQLKIENFDVLQKWLEDVAPCVKGTGAFAQIAPNESKAGGFSHLTAKASGYAVYHEIKGSIPNAVLVSSGGVAHYIGDPRNTDLLN